MAQLLGLGLLARKCWRSMAPQQGQYVGQGIWLDVGIARQRIRIRMPQQALHPDHGSPFPDARSRKCVERVPGELRT